MTENASPSGETAPQPSAATKRAQRLILWITLGVVGVNGWLLFQVVRHQKSNDREHAFWLLAQPGEPASARLQAFKDLVRGGNREWRSARLDELNMAGIRLADAALDGANFERDNLAGATLAGASLRKASFAMANLSNADLNHADLSEAQCYRANFRGALLRRAVLRAAVFQEADATQADVVGADFSDANCEMADFTRANLSAVNFSGARLEGAILRETNLSIARFDGANVRDVDFTNSNWWRAVGFNEEQLQSFKSRFAPTEKATTLLKNDFDKWSVAQRAAKR